MSLQRLKIGDIVKFESGDIWTVTKINENSFDIECLSPGPENIFITEEKCTEFFDDAVFVILTRQEINQLKAELL